jgi:hypothetical protein
MSTALALVPRHKDHWLTAEEIIAATGWTDRWLREKESRGEIVSRESTEKAANGRFKKLYLAASFPAEIREKLLGEQPQTFICGPLFKGVAAAPIPERRILLPDPADQAQAEQRLATIRPILDYAADPNRWAAFRLANGTPVTSQTRLIRYIAETSTRSNKVSERTLKIWLARFRAGGFAALADKTRADKDTFRWAKQSAQHRELAEIAAYAYLHEHLHKRMSWEIVKARAQQLGITPPSYETVRAQLDNLPAPLRTLALEGRRKYDEIFAPYIRRGYTDFEANEIWVSDHAIIDVLVQNDLFDQKTREAIRLRFTGILDMRSRKMLAYAWSQEGSSRSITRCLRMAIQLHGPGRLFYCDNGKDYKKAGGGKRGGAWLLDDMPPEVIGVIGRVGMETQYCQPFHPQAKAIERYNNTMHQRLDRRFKTYSGPSPDKRPDRCIAALERHQKLLAKGRADESDLPLASEYIRAAAAWIESEYNERTKDVEGMKGLTPNQAFAQYRWQQQPPTPEPHVLACLLAERTQRTIHDGRVELMGRKYTGVDDDSRKALHDHSGTGEKYTVAYDYPDADLLAVIDADGYVIAHLEAETLVRHAKDADTQAAIAASMQERGRRYKETRGKLDELKKRVLATGYMPQHDQMLAIGSLPIDIDQLVVHRPTPARLQPPTPTTQPGTTAAAANKLLEALRK